MTIGLSLAAIAALGWLVAEMIDGSRGDRIVLAGTVFLAAFVLLVGWALCTADIEDDADEDDAL